MIDVRNRQAFKNMPWEEYKYVPGYNNSFFKRLRPEVEQSDGIRLGKMVDALIFEEGAEAYVKDPLFELACLFAKEIKSSISMKYAETQLVATADFVHNGKLLPVKGRLDMVIGDLVVDLKVLQATTKDLYRTIEHFEYPTAMNGYSMMIGAKSWCILAYLKPERRVVRYFKEADYADKRWIERIRAYGRRVEYK